MNVSDAQSRLISLSSLLKKLADLQRQHPPSSVSSSDDMHRAIRSVVASIFLYKAELCAFYGRHFRVAPSSHFDVLAEFDYIQEQGTKDMVIIANVVRLLSAHVSLASLAPLGSFSQLLSQPALCIGLWRFLRSTACLLSSCVRRPHRTGDFNIHSKVFADICWFCAKLIPSLGPRLQLAVLDSPLNLHLDEALSSVTTDFISDGNLTRAATHLIDVIKKARRSGFKDTSSMRRADGSIDIVLRYLPERSDFIWRGLVAHNGSVSSDHDGPH
ncbi:uncharacterized protein EI90DRAFT_3154236 [Cantharellus anzutake]|uniref:uncharacterized protein n=1 Tax=Cantharellus anzutake TaxID=1750568 RepID=UPI0019067D73|nr:uncharacterized protein EI90DRAFT_3154236 [Cantharellus anzutake]KAF8332378.1 hypothetical protein EI90DRAFT_3154236 [Cantharellus anzutake]